MRVTQKLAKEALKKKHFSLDRDPSYYYRFADITPYMDVMEYKFNGICWIDKGIPNTYSIRSYNTIKQEWESIHRVSLKEAVAWANEHLDEDSKSRSLEDIWKDFE